MQRGLGGGRDGAHCAAAGAAAAAVRGAAEEGGGSLVREELGLRWRLGMGRRGREWEGSEDIEGEDGEGELDCVDETLAVAVVGLG